MAKTTVYITIALIVLLFFLLTAQTARADKAAGSKPLTLLFFHVYG